MEHRAYIWGRAATTTIESDIDRIRKKAWLNVFNGPQRIISFKWWVDTLVEDNLDMELNFIHAKWYKRMDTKWFTSDAVSGYLNAPDVTQYVVNCPYSVYLPH